MATSRKSKKMTRRQYDKRHRELDRRLFEVRYTLTRMPKARDAMVATADDLKEHATEWEAEALWSMSIALCEGLNALHDLEETIKKQMADLDDEWARRDWNTADYTSAALVMENID